MGDDDPSTQPLPAPGWYPDPSDAARQRWWDGSQWGDQLSTDPAYAAAFGAPPPKLTAVGEWYGESVRATMSAFGHLLPLIVILIVPISILGAIATWRAIGDLTLVFDLDSPAIEVDGMDEGWLSAIGPVIVAQLLGLAASYLLFSAATHLAVSAENEDEFNWLQALRSGVGTFPPVLGSLVLRLVLVAIAAAVAGLAAAVIGAISPPLGGLSLLVAVPVVVIAVWVRLSLVGTVAAVDRRLAIVPGWRLTAGAVVALIGRFALLIIAFLSIWLVTSMLSRLFGVTATGTPPAMVAGEPVEFVVSEALPANVALYAIAAVFGGLGSGLRQALLAFGSLRLYRDLATSEP